VSAHSLTHEGIPVHARFDMTRLQPMLEEAERRRWLFENLPIDPLHRVWLRQRAWVRTVHGTTRIEGNTLSDLEVEQLLEGSAGRTLPRKDALEVLGTRSALDLADEVARDPTIAVDQATIREIHRRVLDGQSPLLTPGEYRRGENRVGAPTGEIIFTTPPSGDVPELMRSLTDWLADDHGIPAPIRAALGHLELVAIHPFNDGNGRTARILSRLLLIRAGFAFDGLVSLDARLDIMRSEYFAVIRASIGKSYQPGYDATPFAEFFLSTIAAAADFVLARIRGMAEVQDTVRRDVVAGRLPPAMLDALVYAWISRSLRAAEYRRITGRTAPTASRDLGAAASLGYLVAEGVSRDRWYRLGPRLLETAAVGEPADPRDSTPRA
jgi:Fic family protein